MTISTGLASADPQECHLAVRPPLTHADILLIKTDNRSHQPRMNRMQALEQVFHRTSFFFLSVFETCLNIVHDHF